MNNLTIGIPYIKKYDDYSRLVCEITTSNDKFDLWYEVKNNYAKYLCSERVDAFLVALLPYAMKNQLDITCLGTVSSKLYFNICFQLMPILTKHSKTFSSIKINAENRSSEKFDSAFSNATGISCGVDSFDTILNSQAIDDDNFKLSHLTFFNVGSHKSTTNYNEEQSTELFKDRLKSSAKVADLLNLPVIDVNSNLGTHIDLPYVQIHHFCSFSAVLALQKLFRHYYYSSGYEIEFFSIDKCDKGSAFYEPLLAKYLSTETTEFYICGLEKTRIEKLKSIADNEVAQNHLNVCYHSDKNCGECEKCVRTQFELYSFKRLESFNNVFNIEQFYGRFDYFADHMLKHQNTANFSEILVEMKKNNIKLSFKNRIKKVLFSIALKIKNHSY